MTTRTETSTNTRDTQELGFRVADAFDQENSSGWVLRVRYVEARVIRAQSVAITGYGR